MDALRVMSLYVPLESNLRLRHGVGLLVAYLLNALRPLDQHGVWVV
jgi:hypothetical protein